MKPFHIFFILLPLIITSTTSDLAHEEYNYFQNGKNWIDECKIGSEQSPININTLKSVSIDIEEDHYRMGIVFNSSNLTSENENLILTYKAYGNWSTLTIDDNGTLLTFDGLQFHFHSPSEHTINGDFYDAEIHFVHILRQNENNTINLTRNLAVLGVFFQISESAGNHRFFEEYDPTAFGEFELNMSEVLGEQIIENEKYFTYEGSLTTPPCSEVVTWFVMKDPIKVSPMQMSKLQNAWENNLTFANGSGNNRKIMRLNGREIRNGTIDNASIKKSLKIYIIVVSLIMLIINA